MANKYFEVEYFERNQKSIFENDLLVIIACHKNQFFEDNGPISINCLKLSLIIIISKYIYLYFLRH